MYVHTVPTHTHYNHCTLYVSGQSLFVYALYMYADDQQNEENEKWNKFIDWFDPRLGKLIMSLSSSGNFKKYMLLLLQLCLLS